MQMHVRELMSARVISVSPTDSLATAREQLRTHRIHHLLVLDRKRIVGVLSYRDLIGKADGLNVGEVMSRDVVTVVPTDTIRNAAARLLGRSHGCAAVVESGEVTGVLTTTDLLHAISARPPEPATA